MIYFIGAICWYFIIGIAMAFIFLAIGDKEYRDYILNPDKKLIYRLLFIVFFWWVMPIILLIR